MRTTPDVLITQVSDILRLRSDEAGRHLPVRFQAVVTYADTEWQNGFVQDGTGGIYFPLAQPGIKAGQWVEVDARTDRGGYAPQLTNVLIRILGDTNLPTPVRVDLDGLSTGSLDAQWIQMDGTIRQVNRQGNRLHLVLTTLRGKFKALVPNVTNQIVPANLLDSMVQVQGACGSEFNANHQLIGITLLIPGMDQVKVIRSGETNVLAVGSMPIKEIGTYDPKREVGARIKAQGVVSLVIPGEGFFIQDTSGGIDVRNGGPNPPHIGDRVEVLGFPTLGDLHPHLEQADFHVMSAGPGPVPRATSAGEMLRSNIYDHMLVSVKARLLQDLPHSANPELILQDGPTIFTARLQATAERGVEPRLRAGSLVQLVGVGILKGNERHEVESFSVLVPGLRGVSVLENPPWWTPRQTIQALAGMTCLIVGAAAWVALLRRQVREQTKQLLQASREAGMAEVATGVLHNVGNVLNSVNVSANLISDRLRQSRLSTLARIVGTLREHQNDLADYLSRDAKGQQLPTLLSHLNDHLLSERGELLQESESLRKNVDHIKDIVAMQQNYATFAGTTQRVKVTDLIEDTVRMNAAALMRHEVRVHREFAPNLPEIVVDKHKVMQILVNLVRNAKYACDDSARAEKQMILRAVNGGGRVKISVIDNGVGIPAENLTRIFNHGFTTRKKGHGFGLHSGALAAKELGGSLTVFSEGPGLGAAFTLDLPISPRGSEP